MRLWWAIFLYDASALAASRPVVYQTSAFNVRNITDVVYGQGLTCADGSCKPMDLLMDVTLPVQSGNALHPACIFMHGGGWKHGTKTDYHDPISAVFFASRGFVSFNINYRLLEHNGTYPKDWPAAPQQLIPRMYPATRDLKAAIRFVRAQAASYGVDPERIALSGGSAGAISSVGAAVNYEDDYKTELIAEDPTLSTTHLNVSSKVRAVMSHWGGALAIEMAELADPKKRSRYGSEAAAIIEFHGDQDTTVPLALAQAVQSGYQHANTSGNLVYDMHVLKGCGHASWCYGCQDQCKCKDKRKMCNAMDVTALPFLAQHMDLTLTSALPGSMVV